MSEPITICPVCGLTKNGLRDDHPDVCPEKEPGEEIEWTEWEP